MTSSTPETPRRVGSVPPAIDDDWTDPDLAAVKPEDAEPVMETLLASLASALTADVEYPEFSLPVLKRPGVSLIYSSQLDDETVTLYRKKAHDPKDPTGVNGMRFYSTLLAKQCRGIRMNGVEVLDEANQRITPGHKWVRDLFHIPQGGRTAEAIRTLIGNDAHVLSTGSEVMAKCGYGDDIDEDEGPTRAS